MVTLGVSERWLQMHLRLWGYPPRYNPNRKGTRMPRISERHTSETHNKVLAFFQARGGEWTPIAIARLTMCEVARVQHTLRNSCKQFEQGTKKGFWRLTDATST